LVDDLGKLRRECQGLITPPVNVIERPKFVTSIRHALLLIRADWSSLEFTDERRDGVEVNPFEFKVKKVDTRFNKKW